MSKKNGIGKPKKPDTRKISRKLKPRQRKFVANYVDPTKDTFGNGTKAAIAAGYSERSAAVQASQALTNPKIEREIERVMEAEGLTREKVVHALRNGLEAKQTKVFCQDGQLIYSKPMEDHPTQVRAAEVAGKLRGDFPAHRTIERMELLRIQQNILIVPTVTYEDALASKREQEKNIRQLEE